MVAIKNHQAERFVGKPDPGISIILVYGTDAGLVSERARTAAKAWAAIEDPPGEILRLGDSDLDEDRDRLAVELQMIPMFGGRKVIRTTQSQRINANLLKPLIEKADLAATLIIEAGNLKPTDGLRKTCESSKHAAAIACFPDEDRDLAAVIRQDITNAGFKLSPDAEDMLVARLGADRALSRGEIEKLALYCMGRPEITVEDVEQIVGDASELAIDRIVQATAKGDASSATNELARATSAGESAQTVILALQRHFIRLHRVLHAIADGKSPQDALKSLRPPLHFKQRDSFNAQLRSWSARKADKALSTISDTAAKARRQSTIDVTHAERLIMMLAQLASPRRPT
ncbi:MAG: DNA polymerase III subunit delta [Pseudomonadota bacterium]